MVNIVFALRGVVGKILSRAIGEDPLNYSATEFTVPHNHHGPSRVAAAEITEDRQTKGCTQCL